ncbi:PIG-L deacetylase family protein [Lederbergia panacisoli]|uniref:PIG-L deacetylase family protein n=1 Tax=Lederbergia panacisoli TaxID=1255251 RepID=UPI00214BA74F|nr:PIG-L family deacetylase [Lederbergia panacisoli]MCR2823299.1 PIG-L family deacetylase [Lederbergia panacisoli]
MKKEINIIVIGAHADEPDIYAGGTAALFAEMGHKVKFLALTDGCCGHYEQSGSELVERRVQEAQEAAKRLGVLEYDVITDIHDGELLPTLEVRKEIIRQIRRWQADIVISFHPAGRHSDNRYAGVAVMDAAPFVANPNAVPEVPYIKHEPLFLLMPDFSKRDDYKADIVVDIGSVLEKN